MSILDRLTHRLTRAQLADAIDRTAQRIASGDRPGRPVDLTADERWHAEQRTDLPPVGVPMYRPARADLAEQVTKARAVALQQETERHLAAEAVRDQAIGALAFLEDQAMEVAFAGTDEDRAAVIRASQTVRRAL